jgi:tetratricopeptide (TPR) repeat protein
MYNSALHRQITDFLASKYCRQSWILRLLFRQSSTYPLQHIFKQKELIKDWIHQDPQKMVQNCFLDWIQDNQEIFIRDRSLLKSRGRNNQFLDNLMSNISYFDKLMFIWDLSREYTMGGRLAEEERWLTDALDVQRLRFGQESISTAWLINSLGIVYDQQQRVELSAKTQEQALAIQEVNLGPDHLETIWTVNELGRIYRHLGHLERAELMHLQCLQRLRTVLHSDDSQIAGALNTLARTYRKQARFTEAICLHNEALVIQKKLLVDMHPHYLWAVMDVAACYREQGRLEKSAEMYRKALDGRVDVLGVNHADTL